jgi:hypothetical protein
MEKQLKLQVIDVQRFVRRLLVSFRCANVALLYLLDYVLIGGVRVSTPIRIRSYRDCQRSSYLFNASIVMRSNVANVQLAALLLYLGLLMVMIIS